MPKETVEITATEAEAPVEKKMKNKSKVAVVERVAQGVAESQSSFVNPADALIATAIEKNIDLDKLERLLAMKEKMDSAFAKRAFDEAMSNFQSECPAILKSKTARDENRNKDLYNYAPLDKIIEVAAPILSKYGLSYSFRVEYPDENHVKVICIAKHRLGHTEQSEFTTGLASKTGIMSGPQQLGSTVTFNKRYAFCNLFGIVTSGEDDNARSAKDEKQATVQAPVVMMTNDQKESIMAMSQELGIPFSEVTQKVRATYGKSFSDMTDVQAQGVINGLMAKRKL